MKLANLGCGGQRVPGDAWTNVDTLLAQLQPGTPERENLLAESNYVEHDFRAGPMPFENESFDGLLLQHVIEHLPCHDAAKLVRDCHRILKPGGVLVASVPDVDYFMRNHVVDNRRNAVELFGEPISEDWHSSFFTYALFHQEHVQILNYNGLRALLVAGGFRYDCIFHYMRTTELGHVISGQTPAVGEAAIHIERELNRKKFSAIAFAYK